MSLKAKGLRKFEEFGYSDASSPESEEQVDELAGDIVMELDEGESQKPGYRKQRKENGGRNSSLDIHNEDEETSSTDLEKKDDIYNVEFIADHRLKRVSEICIFDRKRLKSFDLAFSHYRVN